MSEREYDVIVIGAGAVGENVADRTVQGGMSTVIVEAELVGGECSYWACMPSKALLRSAAALRAAQDLDGAKQAVTGVVDVAGVLRRRDAITHDWDDASQVRWLEKAGIDLVRGHAEFAGVKRVRVTAEDGTVTDLVARHAVARGDRVGGAPARHPRAPRHRTLDEPGCHEREDGSGLARRDRRGRRGRRDGDRLRGLRHEGHAPASRKALLENLEPFAAELVEASLENLGVTVRKGVEVTHAHRTDKNAVLALSDGGRVIAEQVLVAIGRTPRTTDLGLDSIGFEPGAGSASTTRCR